MPFKFNFFQRENPFFFPSSKMDCLVGFRIVVSEEDFTVLVLFLFFKKVNEKLIIILIKNFCSKNFFFFFFFFFCFFFRLTNLSIGININLRTHSFDNNIRIITDINQSQFFCSNSIERDVGVSKPVAAS